jgi:hypothetical protein
MSTHLEPMHASNDAVRHGGRWERRVIVHAMIAHPVEAVFAHLADPMRWHEFAPAVAFRGPIGDGPARIGSRWMSTDRIGPFRIHFVDELAALEPNRRVVWLSSAPWNARVEYHCSSHGRHTQVRAVYEGTLSGSLRWQVGWLPAWATRWILAQDFRRLDRLLTMRARAAGRWRERHPVPALGATSAVPAVADRHREAWPAGPSDV